MTTEVPLSIGISAKNLDVIVGVGVGVVVVVGGHGDNRGIASFNWHFSVKPTITFEHDHGNK